MDFTRTGGLIGVDEHAHVDVEGTVTLTRGGAVAPPTLLDAARLAELKQALAQSVAAPSASTPTPPPACADGFVYQVRTPSWTATADDCGPAGPAMDRIVAFFMPLLKDSGTANPEPEASLTTG